MTISGSVLLTMKNVSNESCREKQHTHVTFNKFLPQIVRFIS